MTETTKYLEHRTERFVRINDRFAITREKKPGIHCWILREFYTGYKRGKTADEKIPTRKVKQTYYATLEQACMMVIEKSADGETAQAMIDAIHEATKEVVAAIDRHEVAV